MQPNYELKNNLTNTTMKTRITTILTAVFLMTALIAQAQPNSSVKKDDHRSTSMRSLLFQYQQQATKPNLTAGVIDHLPEVPETKVFNPSAIVFQGFNQLNEEWNSEMKVSYTYDKKSREKEALYEMFTGERLIPFQKEVMHYNKAGDLHEIEIFTVEDYKKRWVLTGKELTHADAYGNLVLEASLQFNDHTLQWDTISGTRIVYEYTKSGVVKSRSVSAFDTWANTWIPEFREVFIYDNYRDGLLAEMLVMTWDYYYKEFVNEYREVYFYDDSKQWSEVYLYTWFTKEWELEGKVSEIQWFDFASLKPLSMIVYQPGKNGYRWSPFIMATFEYHPVLREQTLLLESYYNDQNEKWSPIYREISKFDDNLLPVYNTVEVFEGKWIIMMGVRNTIEADADGAPLQVTVEYYDGFDQMEWVSMMRLLMEYDKKASPIVIPVLPDPVIPTTPRFAQVYPNPVAHTLNLVIDVDCPGVVVQVFNASGQRVMQQNWNDHASFSILNMDVSHLTTGVYYVNIQAGDQSQTVKLMKR
jgi:hypothetical protein